MKKILAIVMVICMIFAMAACGSKDAEPAGGNEPAGGETEPADEPTEPVDDPDAIPDEMTSADGKYEIAFVTDVGQLKDKSFNQGTYDGVKLYAAANGLSYKYYQPANADQATDDDRYDAMKAAADNGAKAIVCAGFMQGNALAKAAAEFPDVKFIFIDGWAFEGLDNIAGIAFREEQSGYLAGYATVKEGFTKLGFCGGGGGTNPAVNRYGYGFIQGADAVAAEMGVTVDVNYSFLYGANFTASPELQTLANGWYEAGTEAIFACGGSMFASIVQAASANDGAVIGVDVDQSFESDTVFTSAMKGLSDSVEWALTKAYDGSWDEIGGVATSLGAAENAVGLPVATWSLTGWTVEEYEAMLADIVSGKIAIDDEPANLASTDHVNVNIVE